MLNVGLPLARASVELCFEPSERFVAEIARWVTDFCRMTLEDLELASRLHLAVYELAENLVKYGSGHTVSVDFEVCRSELGVLLRLRTKNRSTPERLHDAVELLTRIRAAEAPVALYDRLILESAPREDRSGLGLARIRAEGELELDFSRDGDELSIVVETRVTPGARP